MQLREKDGQRNWLGYVAAASVFLLVLILMMVGTARLADSSNEQGLEATYDAIRRSAVLCYATEGFYPPSLEYIEDHYGVQIDYNSYVVRYDAMASNLMPEIHVFAK